MSTKPHALVAGASLQTPYCNAKICNTVNVHGHSRKGAATPVPQITKIVQSSPRMRSSLNCVVYNDDTTVAEICWRRRMAQLRMVISLRSWKTRNGKLDRPRMFKLVVNTAEEARSLKADELIRRKTLPFEVGLRRRRM